MSYTLTMDASHKVTRQGGHHRTFAKHIGRDVDKANGVEQKHSNKGIDARRTHLNRTMVSDGQGGWKKAESTDEMIAAVEQRLGQVKPQLKKDGTPKEMRKDAVVMRPLILQLDPEWFKEHCPDWKTTGDLGPEGDRLHDEMLKWAAKQFGAENLPFYSLHLDEWSPQIQLGFVPVTDDGRLAQGEFFKGREALGRMHTEFREHMAAAGYDVSKERKTKDRHIKQMGDAEYKQYRDDLDAAAGSRRDLAVVTRNARNDRQKIADELMEVRATRKKQDERENELGELGNQLVKQRSAQLENKKLLEERQTALDARELSLRARERLFVDRENQAALDAQRAAQALAAAKEREERAAKREAMANSMIADQQDIKARYEDAIRRMGPVIKQWEQANPHTEQGQRKRKSADNFERLKARITARAREIEENGRRAEGQQYE